MKEKVYMRCLYVGIKNSRIGGMLNDNIKTECNHGIGKITRR